MITQERLKEMFTYDAETGVFTRIAFYDKFGSFKTMHKVFDKSNHHSGYIYIRIDGAKYAAHRLVYLYLTGSIPPSTDLVDHIDGNKSRNVFSNLRIVGVKNNSKNRPMQANNTSGVVGVYFRRGMFEATISVDKKKKHLGTFKTLEEAAEVRKQAEIDYNFHENHNRPKTTEPSRRRKYNYSPTGERIE